MTQRCTNAFALAIVCTTLSFPAVAGSPKREKPKNSDCTKPPALVEKGRLSKEDQKKAKQVRMVGTVAAEIAEDGTVQTATVVRSTSEEAGELLVHLAKSMRFAARPGCGIYKTQFNFGTE
jgi:hypothetical protein